MENLVLSDDETVALALLAGRPWPAPLPTVDADDPDQLLGAGRRGLRALAVRELIRLPDSVPGTSAPGAPVLRRELADLSAEVFGTPVQAVGYAATDDLTWLPGGLTTVFYGTGSGAADTWTMQVVSHAGVSYFSRIPAADARRLLSELLHGAAEAGFTTPEADAGPAPRWYCVSRATGGQTLMLASATGEHRLLSWDPASATFTPVDDPGDLATSEGTLWTYADRLAPAGTV
jgi:hypothetical protein